MARVLSGVQPSGALHVGNYVGAFRQWVAGQEVDEGYFCIVDLHALTIDTTAELIRRRSFEVAAGFLAAGLDPKRCTIFLQSHVPEHAELSWILECTASFGELGRMTQFKEKAAEQKSVKVGLFTYPVLMAADILIYDTNFVPVGDDQRQHLELTRDLATRFNTTYGETFVVPEVHLPRFGARVMDLQHPEKKMAKSAGSDAGIIYLDDSQDEIRKKIRRAVTDAGSEVAYDPKKKPGVSNLLDLLAAATGDEPRQLAAKYSSYGSLKDDTAEAVVELLRPIRERYLALLDDRDTVLSVVEEGAHRARAVAAATLARAREAVGLLPRRL